MVKRIGARSSQDGATELANSFDLMARENHGVVLDDTFPAVTKTHKLVARDSFAGEDNASDHRIKTGGIATAGQDSNPHVTILGGVAT